MLLDTIAAIATPLGEGGIGIVKISGPRSEDIALKLFRCKNKNLPLLSHYLYYGEVVDPESSLVLDEVLLVIMRKPYSYTKEDVVEINCHGGVLVLKEILNLTLRQGAVLAEPGEFTKRAFLNGRIDLNQAEAVISIIKSQTKAGFMLAAQQLTGSFSSEIKTLKEMLLSVIVSIEALIGFSEEEIEEFGDGEDIKKNIDLIKKNIDQLIFNCEMGKIYQAGVRLAIVGSPNVGKSCLLNVLLGEERAIVTPIAGTTRDTIEEIINIKGVPVKIIDTAGISSPLDEIIKMGMLLTGKKLEKSDLVILVVDGSRVFSEDDFLNYKKIRSLIQKKALIIAFNKIDLGIKVDVGHIKKMFPGGKIVNISALCGLGIDDLREIIFSLIIQNKTDIGEGSVLSQVHQKDVLEKAGNLIKSAELGLRSCDPYEYVVYNLKKALEYLGKVVGETTSKEILNGVFSRFCVGK